MAEVQERMIRLHNSLSREVEPFIPEDPQRVRMYVCGPTVYGTPHLGNCRPAVVFDVLYRLFRVLYPAVTYARNITDIDDKIIVRAREEGVSIDELTTRTTQEFHRIVDALGCLRPDHEPRATGSIPEILSMIALLIEHGHAYASQGHVLFDISSYPEHGTLSRHLTEDLEAGASNRVEAASYKRAPEDFVLWKPSDAEQPGWDSPWGRGRPGWHIECSAMIEAVFGSGVDVHGGGGDLRFPHHDCEISQSACAHPGRTLSRFWLHNGMVLKDGKKIAKSTGNIVEVESLIGSRGGGAVRMMLLSAHYRQPLNFNPDGMAWGDILCRWHEAAGTAPNGTGKPLENPVVRALCQDLNTPQAFAELHKLAANVRNRTEGAGPDAAFLREGLELLGLYDAKLHGGREAELVLTEEQAAVASEREQARLVKDFSRSDQLREILKSLGIDVKDGKAGTVYSKIE